MSFKEKFSEALNIKFDKAFGLDISDRSVEVMELSKAFSFSVDTYGRIDFPAGVIEEGKIMNPAVLAETIKKLLKALKPRKISTNKVVLSLPESQVYYHSFIVEADLKPAELTRAVTDEVAKVMPQNLNSLYWDFQVRNLPNKTKKLVVFVAVPKDIAVDYVKLCNSIGLEIISLQVEPLSLARVILKKSDKQSMIVDIGSNTTNISVFDSNDKVELSVNVPVAGEDFTKVIAKELKITAVEAEALKIKWGFKKDKANPVAGIIEPILRKEIMLEVKGAIDYYEKNFVQNVDQIYLVGGSSILPGIEDVFSEAFGKQLQVISVGNTVKLNFMSDKKFNIALFANVLGLAMFGASGGYKDMNLLNKIPSSERNSVNKLSLFNMGYLSNVNAFRTVLNNKFALFVMTLLVLVVFALITQQLYGLYGLKDPISTFLGL
ncbi:MAG: pilus assembly protein PilM [bacterium]